MTEPLKSIFLRLENLIQINKETTTLGSIAHSHPSDNKQVDLSKENVRRIFITELINVIDALIDTIKNTEGVLVSIKHQKILRTSLQLITTLGVSQCLLPGVGISLRKRCAKSTLLQPTNMSDDEKYNLLVLITDFFTRSYPIPVLKNIIIALHLSDYLASLIQLAFAPLKKPGVYQNFTMTEEKYSKLSRDKQKYVEIYEDLVTNCFQPTLMKELLVLQSVTDPPPPAFVRRVIAKEMSNRLLVSGGLLSLIKCFIESYNIDTGYEWKKIDMVCKIVCSKHGNLTEEEYLSNICLQIKPILSMNNPHYLMTAVACTMSLKEKYVLNASVRDLSDIILKAFEPNHLRSKATMPNTIILAPAEVEHSINVLYSCILMKLNWNPQMLSPNLLILFQLGVKCKRNQELQTKVLDIISKCLSVCSQSEVQEKIKLFLFGNSKELDQLCIEEYEAGLTIKNGKSNEDDLNQRNEALQLYLLLFRNCKENILTEHIFTAALNMLIEFTSKRQDRGSIDLLTLEDDPVLLDDIDQNYATTLHLLSEISTSPKVINVLKTNPLPVLDFVEHFIAKNTNEECQAISLVLLNTILTSANDKDNLQKRYKDLIPWLKKKSEDESSFNSIICQETLSLLSSEYSQRPETECEKATADVFDDLLPVRAHGIIELTKLIDAKDPETLSKKHYLFCLFQEQLKDEDSYIYLASINAIASLGIHCTEDVLQTLCKEYLQESAEQNSLGTKAENERTDELKMKVGDILVKVVKGLGDMSIPYKSVLLNAVLCACRSAAPLVRASALSALAEIARVIHYRMGTIIYEVLLCIWGVIESDEAIECRRAAVMVIAQLLKGLGQDTLMQLKENLLPLYRTLKNIYNDVTEDSIMRLHAQIALEELNDIVNKFLFPDLETEKQIFVLDTPEDRFK